MSQNNQYNTIEEALRDLREGGRVCDPGKY